MRSAHIHLPIAYFDETRLNQATELLKIINDEVIQLEELFEKKSETENSKWYRERLAKLFLLLTLLSSLSIAGLCIATRFTPESIKNMLSDITSYSCYGTSFVALIGIFLNIPPDAISLSIKAFFKAFSQDEILQLNKFADDLYRLQNSTNSAYYHDRMIELPTTFLYEVSQQFQNLSSLSINTAKACLNKIPTITNNLSLLFSKTIKSESKPSLSVACDDFPKATDITIHDSDEYDTEDDNEHDSLLSPRLVIRQV